MQELTIVECETEDTANRIVAEGVRKRRVRSHEMNRDSSRSHSILTFHCETPDSDSGASRYGKISFVDLAGSERLKMTKSTGDGHKESANINRSLMCLGKVIALLGDPKARLFIFVSLVSSPPAHVTVLVNIGRGSERRRTSRTGIPS